MENGTAEGFYLVEIDGISAVKCSEASGLKFDHSEFELSESNRANPHVGRGGYKISEVSFKHGHALNSTGHEFFQWLREFAKGQSVERRTVRVIVMDEDGQSPVMTYELEKCIPKSFEQETLTAGGNNAAYFKFSVRPEDMQVI
jgi:phage tail-like protein